MSESLSGAMNGATTLVAMSDVPSGSLSISGRAISVNISFWKNASGTKAMNTAMTDLSSRSRSSSRCEISVPSASGSGSPGGVALIGRRCRGLDRGFFGTGDGGGDRLGGPRPMNRGGRRGHRRGTGVVLQRVELDFLFELGAQLAGHRTGAARPAADVSRELRQSLRPEDEQRDPEDQDDLGETHLEHGGIRRPACCPTCWPSAPRSPRPCFR